MFIAMNFVFALALLVTICNAEEVLERVKRQGRGRHGGGLPPGLQKQKDRGRLPPGLAKHENERGSLPPGLEKKRRPPAGADYPDYPDKIDEWPLDHLLSPDRESPHESSKYGEPGGPPINDSHALEELSSLLRQSDARIGIPGAQLVIYVPDARPYHKFENCQTGKNERGHCRFLQYCVLPDFFYDRRYFFNSLCPIRRGIVGVCCPDRHFTQYEDDDNYVYPNTRPGTVTKLQPPVTTPDVYKPTPPPLYKDCGFNYRTKIIGGTEADPKDWRWMAALMRKGKHFCGGALISEQYVITAAHCLNGYNESSIQVRLGEYDFERDDDGLPQDFNIIAIIRHSQFDRFTYKNDICLLKLDRPATFTEYAHPICLPNPNIDYTGLVGIVAGWGTMTFGGFSSKVLRQVSLPVWNNTECDKTYSQAITRHFLCAGSRQVKEDSCQGDSGGPLMIEERDNRWMLVGIVSWGIRCADPGFPGVYTRVTEYLEWIRFHMT